MTLPPFRRVVTAHDDHGSSKIALDENLSFSDVGPGATMAWAWSTATVPADNSGSPSAVEVPLGQESGSIVRIVDFGPGSFSPMHRTLTIDYGVVLSGTIELTLDDGTTTSVGPNSVIVQRGTNHVWRNASATEFARVLFVLIEARPVLHDGAALNAGGL